MARNLAERIILSANDDKQRLDILYKLLACRPAQERERLACLKLLAAMTESFTSKPDDAKALLSTGEAPVNDSLNQIELAAWTQVVTTVLASDVALSLF
jgi:hypothetical protein